VTAAWRIWVLLLVVLAGLTTSVGMTSGFGGVWWPIAGLWLAAGIACFGLSVWVAGLLILLGVAMDLMGEAPVGSWPLALLSAYGVALIAWDRQPPIPVIMAEAIAVIGGFVAASISLGIAASIAGEPGFARGALTGDFIMTAMLWPLVRFVILPASIRVARR
jgi:hypothetical protein